MTMDFPVNFPKPMQVIRMVVKNPRLKEDTHQPLVTEGVVLRRTITATSTHTAFNLILAEDKEIEYVAFEDGKWYGWTPLSISGGRKFELEVTIIG